MLGVATGAVPLLAGRAAGAVASRLLGAASPAPHRALPRSLVEAVLALEQLVDRAEERARLRALDDAMVVGAA